MRISDWSSDVCSSDLAYAKQIGGKVQIWTAAASGGTAVQATNLDFRPENFAWAADGRGFLVAGRPAIENGRASCRARVCTYVWCSEVDVSLKKTTDSKHVTA